MTTHVQQVIEVKTARINALNSVIEDHINRMPKSTHPLFSLRREHRRKVISLVTDQISALRLNYAMAILTHDEQRVSQILSEVLAWVEDLVTLLDSWQDSEDRPLTPPLRLVPDDHE